MLAAPVYLLAGGGWLVAAHPPWVAACAAWFVAVALAGLLVPGPANQVTLARAYLAAPALVYAVSGQLAGLAGCVAAGGISDLADGRVARRFNSVSQVGGALDPAVDGIFFAAVAGGLAAARVYPLWVAILIAARYGLPIIAAGVLVLAGRRPRFSHTPAGQACTLLIAVLLGGFALARAVGWDSQALVVASAVLLPPATLATWINLAVRVRRTPAAG